jgi:cell division protein FtsQ
MLFLLIVGLGLFAAIQNKKEKEIEDTIITVTPLEGGDKLISEGDVRTAMLRAFDSDLKRYRLDEIDVTRVETLLEDDPFVKNAEVYVDQHNILRIKVEQREPVLRILDNNGNNYYLDENGVKMPPSKNFAARALVATGNISPYQTDFITRKKTSTLKDLFKLAQALKSDEFLSGFIQQIHVTNGGEFVMTPLIGDQQIILGSVKRLDDKFRRLKIFYKEGMPSAGWRKYRSVNLKFNGQIVCR